MRHCNLGTRAPALAAAAWALLAVAACSDSAIETSAATPEPEVETELSIESPTAGARLAQRDVWVRGTVRPPQPVWVNEQPAQVAGETFQALLPLNEGETPIMARTAGGAARARIVVLQDLRPPLIRVLSPSRPVTLPAGQPLAVDLRIDADADGDLVGFWTDDAVSGVPPEGGTLHLEFPPEDGLRLLRFRAEDSAGNQGQEHLAVLQGSLREPAPEEVAASTLHLGPAALRQAARSAMDLAASLKPSALLPEGTVLYESEMFRLTLRSFAWEEPPGLDLRPSGKGLLCDVTLRGLRLEIDLESPAGSGQVDAVTLDLASVQASGAVQLFVEDSGLRANFVTEAVALEGMELRGFLEPLLGPDSPFAKTIEDLVEVVARSLLEELAPLYLNQLLGVLLEPRSLPLAGRELGLAVTVVSARGAAEGIDLGLGLRAWLEGDSAAPERRDLALLHDVLPPSVLQSEGLAIALGQDMVNLALYRVWQAGALDFTIDQALLDDAKAEIALVAGWLGSVAPLRGVDPETPIELVLQPELPPIVQFGEGGALQLRLGNLSVTGRCAPPADCELLELAASVALDARLAPGPDPSRIDLLVDRVEILIDVLDEDLKLAGERDYEPIAQPLSEGLAPTLEGLLRSIALPSAFGLRMAGLRAQSLESQHFLLLEASLAEEVTP